jgi:hypothetical protein
MMISQHPAATRIQESLLGMRDAFLVKCVELNQLDAKPDDWRAAYLKWRGSVAMTQDFVQPEFPGKRTR